MLEEITSLISVSENLVRDVDSKRGLSVIPDYVKKALGSELVDLLERDGHGISFPENSGCQMRCLIESIDKGGWYSYKACGGIKKAIELAMSRYKQWQVFRKDVDWNNMKHASFTTRFDKRNGKTEFRYSVGFKREGKPATKGFFIGYDEITADQMFHTYRTAMVFKWYLTHYGEADLAGIFKNWRTFRVYDGFKPFDGFSKK